MNYSVRPATLERGDYVAAMSGESVMRVRTIGGYEALVSGPPEGAFSTESDLMLDSLRVAPFVWKSATYSWRVSWRGSLLAPLMALQQALPELYWSSSLARSC